METCLLSTSRWRFRVREPAAGVSCIRCRFGNLQLLPAEREDVVVVEEVRLAVRGVRARKALQEAEGKSVGVAPEEVRLGAEPNAPGLRRLDRRQYSAQSGRQRVLG